MRAMWHVVRVVCAVVLVAVAATFVRGLSTDDPWVVDAAMKVAYAAGLVLPLWVLWRLLVTSHQRLKS